MSHLVHSTNGRLVGLAVKAVAPRAANLGSNTAFGVDLLLAGVIPVTATLALQWLSCQASGVTGSALGLVGPVSVYCDWVRSAASTSMWQHVRLSEQIRP